MRKRPFLNIAIMLLGCMGMTALADDLKREQLIQLQADGVIQHFEQLERAVFTLHPEAEIIEREVEQEYGRIIYEVNLIDRQGTEWDIELDAVTGKVLRNRQDD